MDNLNHRLVLGLDIVLMILLMWGSVVQWCSVLPMSSRHELGENSFVANHVNARRSRISPMDNLNHRLVLGLDIVPMMLLM